MKIVTVCILAASAVTACSAGILLYRKLQKINRTINEAKEEFFSNPSEYYSCLQPLYLASVDQDEVFAGRVVDLWKQRLTEHEKMSALFCSLEEKNDTAYKLCKQLMDILDDWGVRHDLEHELITLTEAHEKLYLLTDLFLPGDRAEVISPAWYYEKNGIPVCIMKGFAVVQ